MPIFEYQCQDCEKQFERIVRNETEKVECPDCRGENIERLISAFAVGGVTAGKASLEPGPCACGAPRRGMCGEHN